MSTESIQIFPVKSKLFGKLNSQRNIIILILLLETYDQIISMTISAKNLNENVFNYIFFFIICLNIVFLLIPKFAILKNTKVMKIRLFLLLTQYGRFIYAIFITVSVYETKFYETYKIDKKIATKFHLFIAILIILRIKSSSQIQKLIGLIFSVFYLNFRFIGNSNEFLESLSDFIFMLIFGFVIFYKTEISVLNRRKKSKSETIYSDCNQIHLKNSSIIESSSLVPIAIVDNSIILDILKESPSLIFVIKNGNEIIYESNEIQNLFPNKMEDLTKLKFKREGLEISCFLENNKVLPKKGIDNEMSMRGKDKQKILRSTLNIEDEASVESGTSNSEDCKVIEITKGDSLLKLLEELYCIISKTSDFSEKLNLLNHLKNLLKQNNKRLVYLQSETNKIYTINIAFKEIKGDLFLSIQLTKILDDVEENHYSEKIKSFQSKFLKSVSHEMKTPINAAITLLTSCEDKVKVENWNSYISPALNSLFILNSSINDILDYSSLFQKNFDLSKRAISLKSIAKNCYDLFSIQIQTRIKLSLRLDFDEDVPYLIENDGERIKQILINFLTNSFKFTQSGEIVIKVGKVEDEERFFISVQDTGVGFSMENKNKKFTLNDNQNGDFVGLGLRISNKIAKWLNFSNQGLEYDSNTEFTIFKFYISDYSYEFTEGIIKDGEQSEYKSHYNSNKLESNNPKFLNSSQQLFDSNRFDKIPSFEHKNSSENNLFSNKWLNKNSSYISNTQNINISRNNDGNNMRVENSKCKRTSINTVHKFNEMREDEKEDYISSLQAMHETIISKKCLCSDILIVDDNDFNIYALKLCLQKYNLNIQTAVNGLEAINCVKELALQNCCTVYKIIFMDFDMPIMNGHDSSKMIKNYLRSIGKDTKIIGCSAFTSEKDLKKCFESGMDDYEPKPLNNEKVEILLSKWFPHIKIPVY